jgi:hypothetical protein
MDRRGRCGNVQIGYIAAVYLTISVRCEGIHNSPHGAVRRMVCGDGVKLTCGSLKWWWSLGGHMGHFVSPGFRVKMGQIW